MYENNPPSLNPEFDRRTLLRGLGLGVSAAAVGGMIAGCVPETAAPKSGTPLAEDGVKEFNFTTWSMNEKASKDQLQKLIDTYSSINGTKISTPSFPYNEFVKQSILQLRGGQLTGAVVDECGFTRKVGGPFQFSQRCRIRRLCFGHWNV